MNEQKPYKNGYPSVKTRPVESDDDTNAEPLTRDRAELSLKAGAFLMDRGGLTL